MKRFFLLLAVVVSTFSFLPGCGDGGTKTSPADQKKKLEEGNASMQKGMEAMKALKK